MLFLSTHLEKMPSYAVGQTITMQLMKKERGSLYAMPKNLWEKREGAMMSINGKDQGHDGKDELSCLKIIICAEFQG